MPRPRPPEYDWIKLIKLFILVVPSLVTILGLVIGWIQYSDARKQEAEARKIEISKPFLEKQLSLFEEVTALAAKIASTPKEERLADDLMRLDVLYWGELGLVENGEVEVAMKKFRTAIYSENADNEALGKKALDIARACRGELARSWGVTEWNYQGPGIISDIKGESK